MASNLKYPLALHLPMYWNTPEKQEQSPWMDRLWSESTTYSSSENTGISSIAKTIRSLGCFDFIKGSEVILKES